MIIVKTISKNIEKEKLVKTYEEKLIEKFEKMKIEEFFGVDGKEYTINIFLCTKAEIDKYILNNSELYKSIVPDWVTGFTNEKCIHLVYPNESDFEKMIKVGIHEIVHLISYQLKIKYERLRILEEGIAYYLANQMTRGQYDLLKEDYDNNRRKTIKEFLDNSSEEFAQNKGYYYAFFLLKYLKEIYSNEKILYYIMNSEKFISDLKTIQIEFDDFMEKEFKLYK